jgi:thioredoxin reductase (NADPH)
VGGGDSALEEATFLSRFASKVTLVHRRRELRASKIMQERAFPNPKIEFAWNSTVESIHGDDRLTGVTLVDTQTDDRLELNVTGLFIAIGRTPRTGPASSPAAISWITTTGRRSPRPAPAARPRSTPSVTSPRLTIRPPPRATPRPPSRKPRATTRRPNGPATLYTPQTRRPRGRHQAVTDADHETEVLKSDKPVLVDFWAEWCGPCHLVSPILEEINAEHGDKMTFVKMDVDENPLTPAKYKVTGIPALNVYGTARWSGKSSAPCRRWRCSTSSASSSADGVFHAGVR